jgi:hypothetical protein
VGRPACPGAAAPWRQRRWHQGRLGARTRRIAARFRKRQKVEACPLRGRRRGCTLRERPVCKAATHGGGGQQQRYNAARVGYDCSILQATAGVTGRSPL